MNPHTQQFLCGRITWIIWMSMLLLDGCASLHFFYRSAPASPSCIFPEEIIWSALALPFCISSLSIHCFFIPHDFCSLFNFRHVSTYEPWWFHKCGRCCGTSLQFISVLCWIYLSYLISWCGIPPYAILMKGVFK